MAWTGTPDNSPTVTDQHPLPCRTGTYTLQCDDVPEATQYDWTTNVGTISGTGRRVTLDLSQAPPTTATVAVSVRATNPAAPCGPHQSSPRQALFYIPATNTPQAISIDGAAVSCFGSNVRTLSVPPVAGTNVTYVWTVTAGNARLLALDRSPFPNPTPPTNNSVLISFDSPGQVQVTAVATSDCGSPSIPSYANYQAAGGTTPVLLDAYNPFSASYRWLYNTTVRIPLNSPQPGVSYTFGPVSNVRYFTTWPGANPSTPTAPGGTSLVTVVSGPNGAPYIDLTLNYASVASFDLQVQMSSSCGGGASLTQTIHEDRPYQGSYRLSSPTEVLAVADPSPTAQALVLYPNPAGETVQIAPAEAGTGYQWVRVLDKQGVLLREVRASGDESLRQISLAGLPAGLYAVQLFDGHRLITRHLVKE